MLSEQEKKLFKLKKIIIKPEGIENSVNFFFYTAQQS